MGKKLAIRGHSTRGNEVIELLEMMGGVAAASKGFRESYCYYISENTATKYISWDFIGPEEIDKYKIFTLEEFLEKYPYKIGDKVIDDSGESGIIIEMKWDEEIIYKVDFGKECYYFTSDYLRPYKETNMNEIKPLFKAGDVVKLKGCPDKNIFWIIMDVVKDRYIFNSGEKCSFNDQHHYEKYNREVINTQPSKMKNVLAELLEHIKTTPKEELEKEFKEIEEWSNVGPTIEEFMTFCESVNKYKYPTTYKECCEVLMGKTNFSEFSLVPIKYSNTTKYDNDVSPDAPHIELFNNLYKIFICRNAYWKIAGERMELGKPWEPDWNDHNQPKFGIHTVQNNIRPIALHVLKNLILIFPTEEMRDAFYENFKDLIEQCKELL